MNKLKETKQAQLNKLQRIKNTNLKQTLNPPAAATTVAAR